MDFIFFSWQSAVVCAAYFAAGVIDSVCGGGGLLTVPALITVSVPVHYIAGTNQWSALAGNLTAIYKYGKSGNIHIKSGIIAAITAILGGFIGAELNIIIPAKYLKTVMIALIPVMTVLLMLKKDFGSEDLSHSLQKSKLIIYSCLIGLTIGAYQGFYGPGAGMLYMLAFAFFIRLNLVKASGTAKLACLFAAISASLTYAFSGFVIWRIVLVATMFNVIGNYIGASLAVKNGAKVIRPVLFAVIALLFISLVFK